MSIGLVCGAAVAGDEIDGKRTIAVTPRVRWARDVRGRMVVRRDLAIAERILVMCSLPTSHARLDGIARAARGRIGRTVPGMGMAVVELPEGADLAAAAAACRGLPFVTHAGPDRICHLRFDPNDPLLSEQTHLTPIRARDGWDIEQGDASVIIAVVDSGVDLDHPDLAGKMWTNPGEIPGNGQDDDGNGFADDVGGWDFSPGSPDRTDPSPDPDGSDNDGDGTRDDQVTHGTLVAGTAAAIGNNGVGVAGVNWGARVMPVQIFPDDGGTPVSTVIEGMDYAINEGADIINLSLGTDFYDGSFTPAVQRARAAGALIVTAAGNSGEEYTSNQSTWQSPICNDGSDPGDNFVLGLTATTDSDLKASFAAHDSSGRPFIDVAAPGVDVFGTIYQNSAFSHLQDFYGSIDGTSFSTAQASGLAALLLASDPSLTDDDLITIIRDSADNIDALNPAYAGELGAGRISCDAALRALDRPPRPVIGLTARDTPLDTGGSTTLTWQRSPDDGGGEDDVTGYEIMRATAQGGPFQSRGQVAAGTEEFEDSTTDGVDHFYIVRTLEDDQQTDSDTVGPVQSVDNRASTTVDFPAGLSFVGFSVQPLNQDPAALFGVPPQNLDWARYDPGADVYRLLADSPTDPFLQIQLGIGYWLRLAAPATVYPDGFQASPGPFLTSLTPGWNQAANPFDGTADFGGVRVLSGGEELTLAEAAVLGLVNPSGWLYESQSSQYVMLNELLGETDIPAGAAFWMLAFDDVGLATPQPAGGTLGRGPQPEAGEDDWHARLVARSGALADAHNFFGRHSGAPAAVRVVDPPPRPGPDVSLYFLGHDGSRLASAFVSDGQDEMTWPFVVECTVPGAEVQVACPDLSAVPRRYRVLLTDLDSGRRQLLRARRAYTYTAGSGPSRRRFRLTLSCATGDALTITGLAALPARGPGAEITFGLSRTAVVDVDVVNVAGRRVRLVRDGALHQAGRAAITWDGRTNAGTRAPAGVYLVRVRAAAADGQSAAAVARVHVER